MSKTIALATALTMGLAGAADAVSIDFTDTSIWVDGNSTDTVGGATVSLSAIGGIVTQNLSGAPGPVGGLAGLSDGLGVRNDEITFENGVSESITVTFSKPVKVVGLYFLDLFRSRSGLDLEDAIATFSGGEVVNTDALVTPSDKVGFAFNGAFAPIVTTSITFIASPGNDSLGQADYALAGIDLAPIPLPASAALFATAIIGMGLLSRRRQTA